MARSDKWEVYQDKHGHYRWRCVAPNGKIVGASSEAYLLKEMCILSAERHGMHGNPRRLGAGDKWEFYQDRKGEYRWRRKAQNGEFVGAATEGYSNKTDCYENAARNGYSDRRVG